MALRIANRGEKDRRSGSSIKLPNTPQGTAMSELLMMEFGFDILISQLESQQDFHVSRGKRIENREFWNSVAEEIVQLQPNQFEQLIPALRALVHFRQIIDHLKNLRKKVEENIYLDKSEARMKAMVALSIVRNTLLPGLDHGNRFTFELLNERLDIQRRCEDTIREVSRTTARSFRDCRMFLLEAKAYIGITAKEKASEVIPKLLPGCFSQSDGTLPKDVDLTLLCAVQDAVKELGIDAKRDSIRKKVGRRKGSVISALNHLKAIGSYKGAR